MSKRSYWGQYPEKKFYTPEYLKACEEELAERKARIVELKEEMVCPHCRGLGIKDPRDRRTDQLRQWCKDANIEVGIGETVNRRDAALLLDRSPFTLRNWALTAKGPRFRKCPNGRYRYRLKDLSRWIWQNQDKIKFWQ